MKNKNNFFIETDILVEHLTNKGKSKSVLEKAVLKGVCFTSVINASELYFAAQNSEEKNAVDMLLRTMNVLGLHSRYSLSINSYNQKVNNVRDALICALIENNNLTMVTNNNKKYKFAGIEMSDTESL